MMSTEPKCPACGKLWKEHRGCIAMCVEIARLTAALAEAQAVIARLPHTKDGVPITVGMDVWGAWQDVGIVEQIHSNHVVMRQPGGLFWRLGSECYSTAAALSKEKR